MVLDGLIRKEMFGLLPVQVVMLMAAPIGMFKPPVVHTGMFILVEKFDRLSLSMIFKYQVSIEIERQ
jgi:hypothetical protein